ncbi:hypothetical protein V6N11_041100 [Hibiscus sabdariffa]|uniref:Fe2OG dioxygenase domain-containing protein n=1 Tax=Hibiscus sabdariffa TaxID=183260 RepID=A0ABR2RJG9_9ROSI
MAKPRSSRPPARKWSSSTMILTMLIIFTFLALILLGLGIFYIPSSDVGNSPKPNDLTSIAHNIVDRSHADENREKLWVEVISWEPRASIYHNFLSAEECEYLINLAKPHMRKSTVVDSKTGKTGDKHGEGLQVLHYEVGQKYEPHHDYFKDEFNTKNGGQRMATVLMYLSDVEEGGETVFPSAKGNTSAVPWWNELSECGKGGLSVKPKMGDALLFWSMNPDATLDPSSLHGGCPVIRGNKWSSTKWMRVHEYKIKQPS